MFNAKGHSTQPRLEEESPRTKHDHLDLDRTPFCPCLLGVTKQTKVLPVLANFHGQIHVNTLILCAYIQQGPPVGLPPLFSELSLYGAIFVYFAFGEAAAVSTVRILFMHLCAYNFLFAKGNLAQPDLLWRTHHIKLGPKSMRVVPLCLWGV